MLILFICSTDLSDYTEGELEGFAEDIEGRVEVLFESDYLLSLKDHFQITKDILNDFKMLQEFLMSLYKGEWRNKMKDKVIWAKPNILGKDLLGKLKIDWVEPIKFIENHLNIDWT
ncbi:hypothetical protein GCM10027043_38620 [Ferruginibacter profundus]